MWPKAFCVLHKKTIKSNQTYVRLKAVLMSNPSLVHTSEMQRRNQRCVKKETHISEWNDDDGKNMNDCAKQTSILKSTTILSNRRPTHHVRPSRNYSCQTCPWMKLHICKLQQSLPWRRWCASQTCRPVTTRMKSDERRQWGCHLPHLDII